MEEYRIIVQKGKGKPYSLWSFSNFNDCYMKLLEITSNHSNMVNKEFYVNNDFWNNKYQPFLPNITFYTVECRNVSKWETYKEKSKSKNKILPFM